MPGRCQRRGVRVVARPTFAALTPDDVVYLEDLWLTRVDAEFGEDRCKALPERCHLLGRVPDQTDHMLVARSEADLELESRH